MNKRGAREMDKEHAADVIAESRLSRVDEEVLCFEAAKDVQRTAARAAAQRKFCNLGKEAGDQKLWRTVQGTGEQLLAVGVACLSPCDWLSGSDDVAGLEVSVSRRSSGWVRSLPPQEKKTPRQTKTHLENPTANGIVRSTKEARVYIQEIGTHIDVKLVQQSLSGLSLGRLCDESWGIPTLDNQEATRHRQKVR